MNAQARRLSGARVKPAVQDLVPDAYLYSFGCL